MARKISFQKVLDVDSKKAIEVITNFNDYSNFIPGCTRATLISRELPVEIGRLEFNVLGKDYYIESENTLDDSSIIIRQLKGPFKKFEGRWSVTHINKNLCQIDFDATYELPFLLNAITPEHLANNFSKNIIDSFIKRVS
jgi:ribosome-associated toxin RatA of RatAB toxin-antitoxin module